MSACVNRVILIGHLGKDAELRSSGSASVANFSMATSESFKDKNGDKKEETTWWRVAYWGKGAEAVSPYLVKGKQVYVEGRVRLQTWKDRDGVEKPSLEVRADRVVLLGSKRDDQPASSKPAQPSGEDDDDVPFAWLLPLVLPAVGLLGTLLT